VAQRKKLTCQKEVPTRKGNASISALAKLEGEKRMESVHGGGSYLLREKGVKFTVMNDFYTEARL